MPFEKGKSGNPDGKPPGTKNKRTKQWEALGEAIVGHHAEKYNELMNDLWNSEDFDDRLKAADLMNKTLEYFQPKLQKTQVTGAEGEPPVKIIINPDL